MSRVVYILSNNRSGSTLLDQLLGGHPEVVSLGEVHHLVAYAKKDRQRYDPVHPLDCSCGQALADCPFWREVAARLARPIDSLQLQCRFHGFQTKPTSSPFRRWPKRLLHRAPSLMSTRVGARIYGSNRVGADSFALFDAVAEVSGARYITDSSKSAVRYRALYDHAPDRVFCLMLVRDYRGVIHSKLKRGRDLKAMGREWAARLRFVEAITRDVPAENRFSLRYEDLCSDPQGVLTRICDRLGLEYSKSMLRRPHESVHHLGGSPSKFDPERRDIAVDKSYLDALTDEEMAEMRQSVGEVARRWGYD